MRSIQEIRLDATKAIDTSNPQEMERIIRELSVSAEPEFIGLAEQLRGGLARMRGDYAEAIESYRRALEVYQPMGNKERLASMISNIGLATANAGRFRESIEYYQRAFDIYQELDDRAGMAKATGCIGSALSALGERDHVLEYLNKAALEFEDIGEDLDAARMLSSIGIVFNKAGMYPEALEHYSRALAVFEEHGHDFNVAQMTANIAGVHVAAEAFDTGVEYLKKSVAWFEKLGYKHDYGVGLYNLGNAYVGSGKIEDGLQCIKKAYEIFLRENNIPLQFDAVYAIVDALINNNRVEEAMDYVALMQNLPTDTPSNRINRLLIDAKVHLHNNNADVARVRALEAYEISQRNELRPSVVSALNLLKKIAQAQNNFADYIKFNEEAQNAAEAIKGKEVAVRLGMQEANRQMQTERKQRDKERAVLYSALPKHIAVRVVGGEHVNDAIDSASILFLDIVGFTRLSSELAPQQLGILLNAIFKTCDDSCSNNALLRIKTIGDSYLALAY